VEGSRYVRDAALSRRAGAAAPGAEGGDATGVWVQAMAGNSTLDGNTNTARTEANSNGLLVGADREFGGWQVGVLAGTGRTDVKQQAAVPGRRSTTPTSVPTPATTGAVSACVAAWHGATRGEEHP
jgi:outer membrane autotransporter protein